MSKTEMATTYAELFEGDDEEEANTNISEVIGDMSNSENAFTSTTMDVNEIPLEDSSDKKSDTNLDNKQDKGVDNNVTEVPLENKRMIVMVNRKPVVLRGKPKYVFVDIFDFIDFDLSKPQGAIVTNLNGIQAQFMEELHEGDMIEVYWKTV